MVAMRHPMRSHVSPLSGMRSIYNSPRSGAVAPNYCRIVTFPPKLHTFGRDGEFPDLLPAS
jgi:hypothetical protein